MHYFCVRFGVLGLLALLVSIGSGAPARAQDATPHIEWEVKNRFRLFRSEADFQLHVAAYRDDGVLAAEQRLARESDGRGWARDIVERLCVDRSGKPMEYCERDGTREPYLSPSDHRIGVVLAGPVPDSLTCAWSFNDGEDTPQQITVPCDEEVKLRIAYGRTTVASVDIALPDGTAQRIVADIAVRDVLIAGMGDSIAAGEGNPDRAVRLSEIGFCFRRFGSVSGEYYRPGREGFSGNKSCAGEAGEDSGAADWARQSARWESAACHRSLYSYQARTALALAIESPHIAVTFVPLACSGATIATGFLGSQRISECPNPGTGAPCSTTIPGQFQRLSEALATARRHRSDRNLDLVLLTIGANDILFAHLVANVIIEAPTERVLLGRGGAMASIAESQKVLDRDLPGNFARLRAALRPLVGGDLSRVVFVSYGHPALAAPDTPCPGGRDGFDVHPAFGTDATRLHAAAEFVSTQFLPKIKAIALCEDGARCGDPDKERMTFVDSHQAAFASHGVCVRSDDDPEFDRECFSPKGDSFRNSPAAAATDPMACGRPASEYRPYSPRGRWVRTANDSYFTAMTYPRGLSATLQPSNIHDATWGVLSAVYGGAVHPTAEGHAAMADAALPAVRDTLGIRTEPAISSQPLPDSEHGDAPPE